MLAVDKLSNRMPRCQDIEYKILALLIFSDFYSVGGSVRVKEDIEHTNFIIKKCLNIM